jgi:7-carboxy-7-deazaguanine synthase (Cx14CxxC type)
MTYAVKEMFLTLQGEGVQAGRRAVFLRFAGCNLWSGRERDRADAVCRFCDTDFVGTDGENGGRFVDAASLADTVLALWGEADAEERFVVITGGEPMLQLDVALVEALHARGLMIAVESNGTLQATAGIDWLCVSPKAGSSVVQTSGDELKLVWPQDGIDLDALESWDFRHRLVQPMDMADPAANAATQAAAISIIMARPGWRLTLQTHKLLGLK